MHFTLEEIKKILERVEKEAKNYPMPSALFRKASGGSDYGDHIISNYKQSETYGYYLQALALLVRYVKPKRILELGNQFGASTAMMYYEMQPDARMTSVDILKDQRFVPDEIFTDPRVAFYVGDALDLNTFGDKIPADIDFLFTDTIHYYTQLKNEYSIYHHLLADEALVVIDDVRLNDKGRFFSEIPFPKWDIGDYAHPSGFGVVWFKRPPEERRDPSIGVVRALLASGALWHTQSEFLMKRRLHVNFAPMKEDVKVWLARHPWLEKIAFHFVHFVRSVVRRFAR